MSKERVNFGSKLGMVLATAGSAVGLGNVWRFPYMTGQNGGAVFIMVYIGCVVLLGLPCMMSEFIIGRHGAANTGRAYGKMGAHSMWRIVGCMSVLTGFLITGYYAVVSGWCLQYIFSSAFGELNGNPAYITEYFKDFSSSPLQPVLWTIAILAMTHFVIIHGVRSGIERASKIMMPLLFILLLVVVAGSCMLPGAFCSLSIGGRDWLMFGGRSLFDIFDFVTGQIFLPVVGFLTCLFLGWVVPRKTVKDEFTNWGTLRSTLFGVYMVLIRYVCPVCIVAIFLNQLGVI